MVSKSVPIEVVNSLSALMETGKTCSSGSVSVQISTIARKFRASSVFDASATGPLNLHVPFTIKDRQILPPLMGVVHNREGSFESPRNAHLIRPTSPRKVLFGC